MSVSIQAIMFGGAFLAWCAVLYKGLSLWRSPTNPAAWAYWAGFLALALNMTLLMPPITGWIDGTTGVVSLTYFICDAAALLTCWVWLVCLYQLNRPDRRVAVAVRAFGALVGVALAFFACRFFLAPGQVQHRLSADPRGFYLAAYRLLFVGIIALHMAYFIVLLRRYATEVHRPTLRLRLHLMTVASGLVIGFAVNEGLRVLRVPTPEVIGALFLLVAVLAMVVGLTFSRRLDRLIAVARRHRLYVRLYPLWRALYPINPALSFLDAPSLRRRLLPPDDLDFVIRRQVIEIRDWELVLRPFQRSGMSPTVAVGGAREGAQSVEQAASREAARLASALQSWQQAATADPSGPDPTSGRRFRPADERIPEAADWQQEARYLAQVAAHFAHAWRGGSGASAAPRRNRGGNLH